MSQSTQPPSRSSGQGSGQPPSKGPTPRRSSTSPSGTPRAGRRATERRRASEKTTMERLRTPILAGVVVVALLAVGFYVVQDATTPAYACTTVDTVQPAASGELGQVQPDQGNRHAEPGEKITYQICPPASGRHVNALGRGPIEPRVYGPDSGTVPMGWIHNLEHGGVVVLYSCTLGACDEPTLQELRAMAAGLPASGICGVSPGVLSVVTARFDQMPTRFAALVWNRVMYMDELNSPDIYEFYTRYAERIDDGRFVAPPEPQCAVPSEAPSAAPSGDPSAAPSGSTAPSEAPSTEPSAAPSEAPSAAPSAS